MTGARALPRDEVHVWRAALDGSWDPAWDVHLAPDERARAARFHAERDRRRYVTARAILRAILGRYLDVPPAAVRLDYGAHGKPFLSDPDHAPLRFNIAHSGGVALVAVAREREVGIDIEGVRDDVAVAELAKDVCTRRERHALRTARGAAARTAFYRLWTCKEAYMKATGDGLAIAPDDVEVELGAEGAALLDVAGRPAEARRWSLGELHPGPGFAAALAVEGGDWHLRHWRWL